MILSCINRVSCGRIRPALARFVRASTTKHHDLESYLQYLQTQANVATESTYYKGLLYEYTVQHALKKLIGISPLTRCGGTGDNGIDLMGVWHIQKAKKRLDSLTVLVQCKASKTKTGARLFREMEGVHSYHVSKSREEGRTLLIVAAPSAITKQGFAQFQTTDVPILYCQINRVQPVFDTKQDAFRLDNFEHYSVVQGLLANHAAQALLKKCDLSTAKINVLMKGNSIEQNKPTPPVVRKITLA